MTPSRPRSLGWRLTVLVSAFVIATVAASVATSYNAMRQVLLREGGERAIGAAQQVAGLLAAGAHRNPPELVRAASDPVFRDLLIDPSPAHQAAAETRLRRLVTTGDQVLEVWTADGHSVLRVASPAGVERTLTDGPPPVATGIRIGEAAHKQGVLEASETVKAEDGARTLGYLLLRRPVSTAASAVALRGLVGSGARILLATAPTGPWTDLIAIVPAPPSGGPRRTAITFQTETGEWRVGAVADVPGAGWLVAVDFPRDQILEPARPFLRNISLVGLFFLALAIVIGRLATRRVTQPLAALTQASEAIAAGNYTARVDAGRPDEFGRLGASFNAMAGEVEVSRERLEARVRERTRALDALRQSEARHRAIVSVAFDSIVTIDVSGHVIEFNPTAERTFGYRRADVLGKDLADLIVPPRYREAHRRGLARYAATGDGPVIGRLLELTAIRSDGSEFPIEFAIQPIQLDGQTMFTAYLRDLTERRRTDELRIRSLRLEAENQQVREASRLKSEFLANMSHELRTPLNAIIGFSTILKDDRGALGEADRAEFMGHILTSGRHLLQLINDVLDLSKVEAGKIEFRPEPLELDRVVQEVHAVLKETAATKGITVRLALEPLTDLFLDAGRLKQVLYNFVSNALKFTPPRGHITIRARAESPELWVLEVEDTGIGIAEADLSRLFMEFEQLDAGAAKHHGGTGLGLALTKRLVEAQGGQVGVRSRVGVGSTFWAQLPRVFAGGTPKAALVAGAEGRGPAVLVIEDDPRDRAQLVDALTRAGFSVEAVATGADALARCEARAFAAITLDLLLPDESGLDVLRQIRERGRNPDAAVIVVTVVAERHALAGHLVSDILPKPIETGALLGSLRRAGVHPGDGSRVLIVDDDEGAVRLARVALESQGFRVEGHTDPTMGLAAAAARRPSAIVLDLVMPGLDGFHFLDELRRTRNNQTTPVIVWTSKELSEAERLRLTETARSVVTKGPGTASLVSELQSVLMFAS